MYLVTNKNKQIQSKVMFVSVSPHLSPEGDVFYVRAKWYKYGHFLNQNCNLILSNTGHNALLTKILIVAVVS